MHALEVANRQHVPCLRIAFVGVHAEEPPGVLVRAVLQPVDQFELVGLVVEDGAGFVGGENFRLDGLPVDVHNQLVDGGFVPALSVVGATILVQQIEGNLLQPLILERAVALHPLVTVVAVGAGLLVGGLLGAFLAVPLVAIGAQTANYYRTRDLAVAGDAQAVRGSTASGSSP